MFPNLASFLICIILFSFLRKNHPRVCFTCGPCFMHVLVSNIEFVRTFFLRIAHLLCQNSCFPILPNNNIGYLLGMDKM